MIDLEKLVNDELDHLYPHLPVTENWEDVLGRTGAIPEIGPERRLSRVATRLRAARAIKIAAGCALVAAGAFAIVVLAHRQGMSFTDRALAALGRQPVLFAVVRNENPVAAGSVSGVLQLSTGRMRPHTALTEYWYQASPRRLEIRYLRDGKVVAETYNTRAQGLTSSGFRSKPGGYELVPDPALADFLNGYQSALASGKAQEVGHGTIGGRKVTWLSIPLSTGRDRERVAVDAATYRPLRFRVVASNGGYRSRWEIVTAIKTVSVQAASFGPPRIVPQASIGNVINSRPISSQRAAHALGRAALWPGATVGPLPLLTVNLQRLHTGYPRKERRPPVYGSGLELLYGSQTGNGKLDWKQPYVLIQESARPQMAYRFGLSLAGPVTFGSSPVPLEGWLDISASGTVGLVHGGHVPLSLMAWTGQLRDQRLYLTIQASSRALLLKVARRLHQLA